MKRLQLISNTKGFSLVETLLALGVFGVMTLSIASFGSFMSSFNRGQTQKSVVYDYKEELITSLSMPGYWESMVAQAGDDHPSLHVPINPDLLCVKNQTTCNEGTYNLTVISPDKKIRFDALDATAGFDTRGSLCNTFNKDQPDPLQRCPYRFDVTWTAVCDMGFTSCTNPLIRISAKLQINQSINMTANTTVAKLSFYIATDVIPDPVPNAYKTLTNSDILSFGTTAIAVDMTQAVTYAGAMSALNFTSASPTSVNGGSVSFAGQTMNYSPPPNFYGKDQVQYIVTGPSGTPISGTVEIGVMTPHTWLGPAAAGPIGQTSNESNFCGMVVNGVCDRTSFIGAPDVHFVFNDLCVSCDAVFDGLSKTISSVELCPSYTHTITYSGNLTIAGQPNANWDKHPLFDQHNGKMVPDSNNATLNIVNSYGTSKVHKATNEKAFAISGGLFTASQAATGIRVTGGVDIAPGTFVHNNGPFIVSSFDDETRPNLPPRLAHLNVINAPGTDFYDFTYNGTEGGTGYGVGLNIQASFNVKNNLTLNPQSKDDAPNTWDYDTLCTWESGAQVPGTYSSGPNAIAITVEKDIVLTGYGGRSSMSGCKAPQIKFKGAGTHRITSTPTSPAPGSSFNTQQFMGFNQWAGLRDFMQMGAPNLPFLMVDDPAIVVRFVGPIGFRRGLVNSSDSTLDFSNSTIVLASVDAGNITFTPETNPGAIKNPLQDVFFGASGGGKVIIGSRKVRILGKFYSWLDNLTAIMGDGVGGSTTELHFEKDFVLGGIGNFKDQAGITYPVTAIMDGPGDQWVNGSGYDQFPSSEMPYDLVVDKLTGKTMFSYGLIALRNFEILRANGGFGPIANDFSLTIPDSGDNTFVHTINIVPPMLLPGLYVNHNVKIPKALNVGMETGFGGILINRLNTHSTKTWEMGAGIDLRVRRLQIYTDQQASAQDKPITVVGGNPLKFRMQAWSWTTDYQTSLTTTAPGSTVIDIPNMHVETVNPGASWGRTQHFFDGRLKIDSYKAGKDVAVCLDGSGSLDVNTVNVGPNGGVLWNSALLTKATAVVDPTGIIAQSDPAYDCSHHNPRWMTMTSPWW